MPVQGSMQSLTAVVASNSPAGSDAIGTSLDDYLRSIQGILRHTEARGATLTTTASMSLGAATGAFVHVDGTDSISHLGTQDAGIRRTLCFAGAAKLLHSANLLLPGSATIETVAGDVAQVVSEGSGVWRCVSYQRATGAPVQVATYAGVQATTSGTEINFTNIPAWATDLLLVLSSVSADDVQVPMLRLGDAGGIEDTGYLSSVWSSNGASATVETGTTQIGLAHAMLAAEGLSGHVRLIRVDPSAHAWVVTGVLRSASRMCTICATKTTSAALDRLQLFIGSGAFDSGSVNLRWS